MAGATETRIDLRDATTIWELIRRRAELSPGGTMLVDEHDRTITFSELRDRAERVAAGLYERGVRAGSIVSWQLPTAIDTVVVSLALSRLGAVQNPIIPGVSASRGRVARPRPRFAARDRSRSLARLRLRGDGRRDPVRPR